MGNCVSSDKPSGAPQASAAGKPMSSANRAPGSKEQPSGSHATTPAGFAGAGTTPQQQQQQQQNTSANGAQNNQPLPNGDQLSSNTTSSQPQNLNELKPNYSLNGTTASDRPRSTNGSIQGGSSTTNYEASSLPSSNINDSNGQSSRSHHTSIANSSNHYPSDGSSSFSNGAAAGQPVNATNNNNANSTNNSKRPEVKILLLGAGESGKSTILKQMKIIHQNGYSPEEMIMYKTTVYKNLLDCAKIIVEVAVQFDIDLSKNPNSQQQQVDASTSTSSDTTAVSTSPATDDAPNDPASTDITTQAPDQQQHPYMSQADLDYISNSIISPDPDSTLDPKLALLISKLWAHPAVKDLLATRRADFYIMDSAPYFFRNVSRIGDPEFVPTVADILRARIKTTGIYDAKFSMGQLNIHMYDVGGQRSERKKWIHCFDNVTLIIFCVALSDYDQVLLEESSQNRMAESLVLFESIVNSRWFTRTTIVLFLNKIDIFTEKLSVSPLENYFPDYTGGDDIKKAAKYILWRFTQLNRNNLTIYPHITQATDTSNIRLVFAAVKESILENSLRDSGLL